MHLHLSEAIMRPLRGGEAAFCAYHTTRW